MNNETVTLPRRVAQETCIALRDRKWNLQRELSTYTNPVVRAIAQQQLTRIDEALEAFNIVLGEKG